MNLQENELSTYYHKEACLDANTCGEAWVVIMCLQLSLGNSNQRQAKRMPKHYIKEYFQREMGGGLIC